MFRLYYYSLLFLALNIACNSPFTPKPKGYYAIDFPAKIYQSFNEKTYPYQFEIPTYARVVKDTNFFEEKTENPWWINIEFPQFNAKLHLSYKALGKYQLEKLTQDAFTLTQKHSAKAYSIEDSAFTTNHKNSGVFFKLGGDVATANRFFVTDNQRHFLTGALYFDATPNEDSLKIINDFILKDIYHLVNTLSWK